MNWWQRLFACQGKQNISKQDIGRRGEDVAAQYLQNRGMRILHRNWRHGSLELDLVGEDVDGIAFVEVKTRKKGNMTTALEAMGPKKKSTFARAAQLWLMAHEGQCMQDKPCRLVVVAVEYSHDAQDNTLNYKVELYDHAFNPRFR